VGRPYAGVIQEALGLAGAEALDLGGAETRREAREVLLGQRWFRATADPTLDEHRARTGAVHILTDITQRKELEEQLRKAQKLEAVGRLAGGVAHDFNNLLTAIVGNAALLQQQLPAQEPEHQLAATIERAAWRAAELTRRLLGFSRQTLLWLRPTNLNDTVAAVAGLLGRTIDPRVRLEVRPHPGLWAVQADPGQISQVLMNLCVNACDAMPEGGHLILETGNRVVDEGQARAALEARPGPFACLSVSDTGHGIPAELLPRIFDPFFTTKPPGQGTGLGLAMAFGIVKQHQGWIECHTEAGRGTRFEIYLPRLEAPAAPPGPTPSRVAGPVGSETILLADDNDMIRTLAATFLRQSGFQVLLAGDGQEAVEVFRREHDRVQLVVLDMRMPRLSGREALTHLRQIDPGVRVLFASGYADTPPGEGEQAGVLGFIAKPYRQHDLVQAVRQALDRPRPERPSG
jgi:signal transduction histidine kinase/CheY-like chemotaxis protein